MMSAVRDRTTLSKHGRTLPFWSCLLTVETVTCLGLLASFDYVDDVENRIMTWPVGQAGPLQPANDRNHAIAEPLPSVPCPKVRRMGLPDD
ncbi:hypothetical protein [Mycobacterium intracellulare]|uniref:hypothetical protein n=1 Tax=Mycobacterium intracellulare TaxID=1767 RepID=UPI001159BF6C|nr:hypothetical protein [Mycobacterium intracellulare]